MSGLTDRLREEKLRGIYGHIDRQRIEAADTIDALTAERDQLKREAALQRVSDFGQIQALTEERDALREDAERYRWLRHGDNDERVIKRGPVAHDFVYLLRMEKLDAAIDAARKGEA